MPADFPFRDGQRFLIDDDQEHVHTVMCRRKPAEAAGSEGAAAFALTTAGGYPVIYHPDTGKFRILILGRSATRRV
jgi:hypothetical protein